MKIWLPYVRGGSGTDVFTRILADALAASGHQAVLSPVAHIWQYFPWGKRFLRMPPDMEIVVTNSWNGFAFRRRGTKLVVVEHLCVHDAALRPYRSTSQALFHNAMVRHFESASFRAADAVVAVSRSTADAVLRAFPEVTPQVIHNATDTDFFCPRPEGKSPLEGRNVRLLYVGNLTRRKGADLLPGILRRLGSGFELHYTSGLRVRDVLAGAPGVIPLGRLNRQETREAYRDADILLFPTRLEGLSLTAIEALACGTPVISSCASSMPEIVEDGVTGRLCPLDDVEAFAAGIRELAEDPNRLREIGKQARAVAVERFNLPRMAAEYVGLFTRLLHNTATDAQSGSPNLRSG